MTMRLSYATTVGVLETPFAALRACFANGCEGRPERESRLAAREVLRSEKAPQRIVRVARRRWRGTGSALAEALVMAAVLISWAAVDVAMLSTALQGI